MSTKTRIDMESRKDPDTLEREIEARRAEIRNLVAALEQRLSPSQLADRALGYLRANGGAFAGNLGATLRDHPVPAVLTGVGLLWLMAAERRGPNPRVGASADVGVDSGRMRERVSGAVHETRERLGARAHQAGDSMHRGADALRRRAHDAREGFSDMLEHQPLAVGAIGAAIGALLGALLPRTPQEDALIGGVADRTRQQAAGLASETLERADEQLAQRSPSNGRDSGMHPPTGSAL